MNNETKVTSLSALLGDYPNTLALKKGEIRSASLELEFAGVKVPNTAFKDVVRNLKYDIAELAIVTYLQAKTHGKPLALLPAVVVGTLPHPFLAYNAERVKLAPSDLVNRRVGIRAYSVTTAAWIRGILQNDHGVDLDSIQWITFEDAHVAEYSDPPTARRAPAGKSIMQMLLEGEIDAGIVGAADLQDQKLKPVIPNAQEAARAWCEKNGALPINHMLVVKQSLLNSNPMGVKEVFQMLRQSKPPVAKTTDFDPIQFGVEKIRPSLELIMEYSVQQKLIPKKLTVDELFDDAVARW